MTSKAQFACPDDTWKPFGALMPIVTGASASAALRKHIQDTLKEYRVFWAPEHKAIDPDEKPVAWYECDECNDVHRLVPDPADPRQAPPWGCSVLKAHQDRVEKAAVR